MTINSTRAKYRPVAQLTKTAMVALTLVALVACGGNKKPAADAQPVADITRPPQTIDGVQQPQVQERNPEEAISFDEWRKRRLEELREQQTP